MKKILSFVLAFGMMLSVLSIIPAQAAPVKGYPFIYEDFETDRGTTTGDVATWVKGGAHGTNGALYFNQTSDRQDIKVTLRDPSILKGKFKMSAWVKLDTTKTKLAKSQFGFVFWAPSKADVDGETVVTPSSWELDWRWDVDLNALNRGEWVYIEKVIENWDGVMSHGQYAPETENATFAFAPRLGVPNEGVVSSAVAKDSPEQAICWWLDDFIIEPVIEPYSAKVEAGSSNVLFHVDFSEPIATYSKYITVSESLGSIENGYFHFKSPGNTYNNFVIQTLPIKYNKIYKMTFRAKANDDATVGGMLKMIAIRLGVMDKNDTFYHYQFIRAMDAETGEECALTKEWREYELYFSRQVKAAYHQPLGFQFRAYDPDCTVNYGDKGKEPVDFMIDDMKLEELPTVTNGDFEWLKGDVSTTLEDNNLENNDSKLYGTFYGWRDKGATVAAVTGRDSTRAAKITVTEQGGHIEQGIYIKNNTENVIKFWAKGEGDSVGKSIQVKLDRDVTVMDSKDVYNVNTEVIGQDLVLTDDWKEYSIRYDLKATMPTGANQYAEPRAPFLSFVVDGGAKDLTYYVDDVEVGPYVETYELPYATDLMVDGTVLEGETVTFSYLYNNDKEIDEGNSIVRILKRTPDGNYVTLAQRSEATTFYDFVIPKAAVDSKLKFEILPATVADDDGDATYGAVYSIETDVVKPAFTITPTLGEFDEQNRVITGKLAVVNNMLGGNSLDMFLAIVLYDEDGGIVRYDFKPISVGAGLTDDISLSVPTTDVEDLKPVAYAKAFTWNGTGIFDTDLTSMAKTITVTRK